MKHLNSFKTFRYKVIQTESSSHTVDNGLSTILKHSNILLAINCCITFVIKIFRNLISCVLKFVDAAVGSYEFT